MPVMNLRTEYTSGLPPRAWVIEIGRQQFAIGCILNLIYYAVSTQCPHILEYICIKCILVCVHVHTHTAVLPVNLVPRYLAGAAVNGIDWLMNDNIAVYTAIKPY